MLCRQLRALLYPFCRYWAGRAELSIRNLRGRVDCGLVKVTGQAIGSAFALVASFGIVN